NAAANSLIKYARRYASYPDQSRTTYSQFKAASLRVSRNQAKVGAAMAAYARSHSAADKLRVAQAQSDLDAARLQRDTLRYSYGTSEQGQQASPVLRTFSVAGSASNDRL